MTQCQGSFYGKKHFFQGQMDKRTYLHLKHQNYRTTSMPPPPAVAREVELEH